MTLVGSSCFIAPGRSALGRGGAEEGPIFVWLWREHDLSTDDALGRDFGAGPLPSTAPG